MGRISYSDFLKKLYGCKVQKLNLNAGFTCPNRDGTLSRDGCSYCNNSSFTPGFGNPAASVAEQLADAKKFYAGKYGDMKFVAYFQSFTSTYAPVSKLRPLYNQALSQPQVIGIVVSTRPDCLSGQVLDCLSEINSRNKVIVEVGVETSLDSTLHAINRHHTWQQAHDAIIETANRNIAVGAHLILGLPGESVGNMIETVRKVAQLPLVSIKFHQLQILKDTQLAKQWNRGEVDIIDWSARDYARLCATLEKEIPQHIAIERWVATAPASLLIHPRWGLKPHEFNKLLDEALNKSTPTI